MFYNESDPLGAYRMWYTTFSECPDNKTDDRGRYINCGDGRRWFLGLYANSSDGLILTLTLIVTVTLTLTGLT